MLHRRASASTNAAADRWLTATPFGAPVDPDVKITHASSLDAERAIRAARCRELLDREPVADDGARAGAVEHVRRPRRWIVRVDRHVCGAGLEHAEDRDVQLAGAARDADADAVARSDPRARRCASQPRR